MPHSFSLLSVVLLKHNHKGILYRSFDYIFHYLNINAYYECTEAICFPPFQGTRLHLLYICICFYRICPVLYKKQTCGCINSSAPHVHAVLFTVYIVIRHLARGRCVFACGYRIFSADWPSLKHDGCLLLCLCLWRCCRLILVPHVILEPASGSHS